MAKPIIPLTDAKCRGAKYSAAGGNKFFDGGGLYLHVLPTGAKKWRMKFRGPGGKENLLTFGDYPAVTLTAARAKRDEVRGQIAAGVDPAIKRDADRVTAKHAAASTFEAVAKEWLELKVGTWSAKHAQRIVSILEKDTYPKIGRLPMSEVTETDVLRVLRAIEKRGAHEIASKAIDAIGLICRYAVGTRRARTDVSQGLRSFLKPRPPVKHYPHVQEAELPELLKRIEGYSGAAQTRLAIKLLNLTFLRTNELRWAEWTEFDFQAKEWRVPASRMKGDKKRKENGDDHIVSMCGRIRQRGEEPDYFRMTRWEPAKAFPPEYKRSPNVPPGTRPLVMHRLGDGSEQTDCLFWGYKPPWYQRGPACNARLDTVLKGSPFWRPLLTRRIILPCEGWYEWTGPKGDKQPWFINAKDGEPILMAGITAWQPGHEVLAETGFAVITDDAAGGMVDIHDRRPICLAPEDTIAWVDPEAPVDTALELLSTPRPESAFQWWQVTRAMGNSRYQMPDASEPI